MAIKCIDSVDFECAITLAGVAKGQIDEKQIEKGTKPHLFRVLRSKFQPEPVNEDITWMKHVSGAFDREVTEFDVADYRTGYSEIRRGVPRDACQI